MNRIRSNSYKEAGVDIDLAGELLDKMKKKLSKARRPEMLAPIGGFGGLFKLNLKKYKSPILVSSIDGVGTKLMVAMMMDQFYSVGYDIVNHCINDIAVQGAEPIYFMDYIGIGKLKGPLYKEVLSGIADACSEAGCALLGGETAEMPGMYGDDFDLVGVITGVVEEKRLITGKKIKPGYVAVGIASNGLHTNGFSLARRVLFQQCGYSIDTELKELGGTIGEALLKPHISYWPAIKKAMDKKLPLDGIAHITGGGLYDNVPRILPNNVNVMFDRSVLPVLPIFTLMVEEGNIALEEAYRVFNMGIGMVWFVPEKSAKEAVKICRDTGFTAGVIGKVVKGSRKVFVE
ncbi:MAG TPA: phosphoribosylformylglycinamidine cyclo-ligase [Lentisphaeria bacterium]|nr:MAG: phosphoribosylformylglycinamidine cyclo-ligase [Lentisphaerae bacterium GWF2_49_21]HBC87001.1 phosphoribosylformylglycinamidine cyclo-ligase [Lentisphaeria bacterium]